MGRVLIAVEEMFPTLILLVLALIVIDRAVWRDWKRTAGYAVFALYLAVASALVGLPNIGYVRFGCNFNFIPFVGMAGDLKNSLLNVGFFIPIGFCLYWLWEPMRRGKRTVWEGFCISLFVELAQIFTFRASDVNDLITNTLGTFLGYLLAKALIRSAPRGRSRDRFLLYGLVLLTRCVAFPILWHLIYG